MLQRGDLIPHFEVTRLDGSRAAYDEIWQRKKLLLVLLPLEESAERATGYASELEDGAQEFTANETECVITADTIADAPRPGVLIADRWGEIYFVSNGPTIADLPNMDEILEWLRFIEHECPECQGETR